jgi:hypothetical protein
MKCLNKEINCDGRLQQEHTKMWSRENKDIDTNHAYVVIDNWHCKKCGSVFPDAEVKEALDTHDCGLSPEDGCNCQK